MTSSSNPLGFTDEQIQLLRYGFVQYNIMKSLAKESPYDAWTPIGIHMDDGCPESITVMKKDGWIKISAYEDGYGCIALTEKGAMMCMMLGFAK